MEYELRVYYQTEILKKISESMREMMPDWHNTHKRLEGCRIFTFSTKQPLTAEEIRQIKAIKEDWMEEVELEEIKGNPVGCRGDS